MRENHTNEAYARESCGWIISFNLAGRLLCLLVVVYAYEKDVAGVVSQLGRIVLLLDLTDGSAQKRLHMH